jgi:hypothetical protein
MGSMISQDFSLLESYGHHISPKGGDRSKFRVGSTFENFG